MQRNRLNLHFTILPLLFLVALAAPMPAQKTAQKKSKDQTNTAQLPEVIWRDPGDVASLNLLYGAGGAEHAPKPDATYTFVKEDKAGSNPKFDVKDNEGVVWKVKAGEEAQAETAATRLLWAAGYFVDEDYYLPELQLSGKFKLTRGNEFVTAEGVVRGARLERKLPGVKKAGRWYWASNPFVGKQEFNGLRVMMVFLNNWDVKDINNTIYVVDGERRYAVTDVGATFGKTGGEKTRSKSNPKDYASSKFIEKASPEYIDFVLDARGGMVKVAKHVPRADVKWLAQRLSQLTEGQIRDAFRAAGYKDDEITIYTQAVQKRIAELAAL